MLCEDEEPTPMRVQIKIVYYFAAFMLEKIFFYGFPYSFENIANTTENYIVNYMFKGQINDIKLLSQLNYILHIMKIVDLLILVFQFLSLTQAYTYVISKQYFTQSFTDNDFNIWNPFGANNPIMKFSNCSNNRIFGGHNVFVGDLNNPNGIVRTWSGLISHYSITISAKIYKIDSWVNSSLFVLVDGVSVQIYTFTSQNRGTVDLCGNPNPIIDSINTNFNQVVSQLNVNVPHSSSNLNISIVSNLVSSAGAWGIRELQISLAACDQSCLTCSNSTSCSSCDTTLGLVLVGAFCACQTTGTYLQKITPCNVMPCASCTTLPCSNGQYCSHNRVLTVNCEPCNVACSTCISSVNSASTCSGCKMGFIWSISLAACLSCAAGCASCTGILSTNCNSCLYSYFLYTPTSSCLSTCPDGWYPQEKAAKCFSCSSPCLNCIGKNNANYYCLSCVTGTYFYNYTCYSTCPNSLYGYQGSCISSCPSTTYLDSALFRCISCISNCTECSNSTLCIICQSSTFNLAGICYSSCPGSYYGSIVTKLCILCHSQCLTCDGPFNNNCLSCPTLAVLLKSSCYTTCPSYTYSALCLMCDQSCLTCNGAGSHSCLTCPSPLFYHLNQTSCISTCNKGQLSSNHNMTCWQCQSGYVAYFENCVRCHPACLTCNDISFLSCVTCINSRLVGSACVLENDLAIVYSPQLKSSNSLTSSILFIAISHLLLNLMLQILFRYKTNILITVQLLQLLSYTYYLTIQMTSSTQYIALVLMYTNFASFVQILKIPANPSVPTKFLLMNKTGYFLIDALGLNIIMLGVCIIFIGVRFLSKRFNLMLKIYQKINPYLITYTFRLVFLQLSLDMMLYLYCFDAYSILGIFSLILLIIDSIIIVACCRWKIKTEEDGSQIALFYFNEIGQKMQLKEEAQQIQSNDLQNNIQSKIKSNVIFPSILNYITKTPLPITILIFIKNSTAQSICLIVYFSFYLLLSILIPYRRRIYKITIYFSCIVLLFNAFTVILVNYQLTSSYALQVIWLITLVFLFLFSFLQLIANYQYLISLLYNLIDYATRDDKKQDDSPSKNQESHSNLSQIQINSILIPNHSKIQKSGQLQSTVIFERVQTQAAEQLKSKYKQETSFRQLQNSKYASDDKSIRLDLDL